MTIFEMLQATPLASYVDTSPWFYPFLLTVHGLGMAVVVGLAAMTGIRILGFPSKVPLGAYDGAKWWLIWAFVFNFLTGLVLFIHDAVALSTNLSFQIKVVSLIVGVIVLWRMYSKVVTPAARAELVAASAGDAAVAFNMPSSAKFYAVASILIWWLSVIVSGRLVAYLAAAV